MFGTLAIVLVSYGVLYIMMVLHELLKLLAPLPILLPIYFVALAGITIGWSLYSLRRRIHFVTAAHLTRARVVEVFNEEGEPEPGKHVAIFRTRKGEVVRTLVDGVSPGSTFVFYHPQHPAGTVRTSSFSLFLVPVLGCILAGILVLSAFAM